MPLAVDLSELLTLSQGELKFIEVLDHVSDPLDDFFWRVVLRDKVANEKKGSAHAVQVSYTLPQLMASWM